MTLRGGALPDNTSGYYSLMPSGVTTPSHGGELTMVVPIEATSSGSHMIPFAESSSAWRTTNTARHHFLLGIDHVLSLKGGQMNSGNVTSKPRTTTVEWAWRHARNYDTERRSDPENCSFLLETPSFGASDSEPFRISWNQELAVEQSRRVQSSTGRTVVVLEVISWPMINGIRYNDAWCLCGMIMYIFLV